ncbi:MAG: alanine--tRNA ligase [Rhodothermales bacterium]
MKTSAEIRQDFLRFFERRGHQIVPSDSLVPKDDPTLLFTNAGMNQFKDVFLETGTRPYNRAVDTQKVLRVSGKHNDLEEVGLDTYHHTFFEMLGNWSFGDYFKKEAIGWAWELLIKEWGLDPSRVYATVHGGDEGLGLESDEEAAGFWASETGIPREHILYFGSKDNFWMMGDTGPCGPCSEIHYDMRSDEERAAANGAGLVNAGDPRVIEVWNLVFIQYEARPDGSLRPLSAKHVDTGMGFERMVAVLQGKSSNYDTDLFAPLLARIAELSPVQALKGYDDIDLEAEESERARIAMRVIADHARAVSFAISDGVLPGNGGRGYVIRRILRRAIRYGYQTLGFTAPFMDRLLDVIVEQMGSQFPELTKNRDYVARVIRSEEESFLETLGTGITFFERIVPYVSAGSDSDLSDSVATLSADKGTLEILRNAYGDVAGGADRASSGRAIASAFLGSAKEGLIPGEVAFLLHDTYGFPVDLTQQMAREAGVGVEMGRYEALMEEQRERARAASQFGRGAFDGEWTVVSAEETDSVFVGYDREEVDSTHIVMMRLRDANGDNPGQAELVLGTTPFYAESGGQVGDVGEIISGDERLQVLDTFKEDGRIVHLVDRAPADATKPVRAAIASARRAEIKKHHSVTHLMHAALREVLGKHVSQKGSLVAPDRLRFDFGHFDKVSDEQLAAVSSRVNEMIQRNLPRTEERDVPIEDAMSRGATALFGEKYGERVRIISFDPDYSMELCGGTHVAATGEIGLFLFLNESSVAAGVRRVEAVAGNAAIAYVADRMKELHSVESHFKASQGSVAAEVAAVLDERKTLAREVEGLKVRLQAAALDDLISAARVRDGIRILAEKVAPCSMETLRSLGQEMRERMGSSSLGVLGTVDPDGEKVYLVASVSDDLVKDGIKAGEIVSRLARIVGGGGGGRPELATAGGKTPEKIDEALAAVDEILSDAR